MIKWFENIIKHLPNIKVEERDDHSVILEDKITLHRDIYENRKHQVLSRLDSLFGKNQTTIYARNTNVVTLSKSEAEQFVNNNHLMGYGGGKVFLGLRDDTELVAVVVFSKILFMKYENPPYYSVELERYCSLTGTTVLGGLDKLIKAYLKDHEVNDVVTYIDKEWSNGSSYLKIGFEKVEETSPILFQVDRKTLERAPRIINTENEQYYFVQNKGNVKMRLTIAQFEG